MEWFSLTGAHLLTIMPTAAKTAFDAWLAANPDQAERIEIVVAQVVSTFRAALRTNPLNSINPDTTTLPSPMLRDAETLALASVYKHIEYAVSDIELSQIIRAEISLRTFFTSNIPFTEPDNTVGFPTYNKRTRPAAATPAAAVTTVASPTFSPGTDTYETFSVPVVISSATPGAVIRYTTDNSTPTAESASILSGQTLDLPMPATLRAYAFKRGMTDSAHSVAYYTLQSESSAAYVYQASSPITTEAGLVAWSNAVPALSRITSPAYGAKIAVAVAPGTVGLVIAYPASLPVFTSAVQRSTGQQVRLSWINSADSTTLTRFGVSYRVYQWFPSFPWSFSDSFDITL